MARLPRAQRATGLTPAVVGEVAGDEGATTRPTRGRPSTTAMGLRGAIRGWHLHVGGVACVGALLLLLSRAAGHRRGRGLLAVGMPRPWPRLVQRRD